MAALSVEHLKVLMVEHLKVLSLTVEPAFASLSVEPPKGSLSVEPMAALTVECAYAPCRSSLLGPLPQKRVARLSYLFERGHVTSPIGREFDRLTMAALAVEPLFLTVERAYAPCRSSPCRSLMLIGWWAYGRACLRIMTGRKVKKHNDIYNEISLCIRY